MQSTESPEKDFKSSPNVLLYNQESEKTENISIIINQRGYVIYGIFHSILTLIAVYLSWKCNNGKFDILSFIVALFVPYIYIIYIFATKGTCNIK